MHNLLETKPIPVIFVPPGPKPESGFNPAKGKRSIKGLSLSNKYSILSRANIFFLERALFTLFSVPCFLLSSR